MTVVKALEIYGLTTVVFFGIDIVWITVVAKGFYQKQLGDMMRDVPNWPVALGFYLLYIVGILVLAVLPAHDAGSVAKAVFYGATLGLVAYATYDLTNLATLKDWPAIVSVVDLIWGTTITAVVSTAGYYIARWIL